MRRTLGAPGAVLLAALAAAGRSDAPSGPTPVASVQVTAPTLAFAVGESVQATATTSDARAVKLTGRAVTGASLNVMVATVTPAGLVTGVSSGAVTIEAASEGKRASSR
jgi:uncharacterized protein YjdB